MVTFKTRTFGSRSFDGDGYFKAITTISGSRRKRSLHIDITGPGLLLSAAALLDDVDVLDGRARAFIEKSYHSSDSTVRSFMDDQLAELDSESIEAVFGVPPKMVQHPTFLAKLELVAIAVHSVDSSFDLVLDYSIGPDISDELLAVQFSPKGEIIRVAHES